jgi:hypothetical protein
VPIWDPRRLEVGGCYEAKLGLLRIWLKHTYQDWFVAGEQGPFVSRKELLNTYVRSVKHEPASWRRWIFEAGTDTVTLSPRTPDRGVVVQPDMPLVIPPAQRALFFVTIPMWISVTVGEGVRFPLCEIPTTTLSHTWFGDFASGELCYSLRSRAKRKVEHAEHAVHSAVCPVQVTNASAAPLEFLHLCIHSEFLGVYQVPGRLWTNRVDVLYQGTDQESQVTVSDGAPDVEGEATLLSPARKAAERSLMRRSFHLLRSLTGM